MYTLKELRALRLKIKFQLRSPLLQVLPTGKNIMISLPVFKNILGIATDALTYITMKTFHSPVECETFLVKVLDRSNLTELLHKIVSKPVTFKNAVKTLSEELGLPSDLLHHLNTLPSNEALKKQPDLRAALEMYLLKGQFLWVPFDNSEFITFMNQSAQSVLREDASINCWEAVLYGLIQSDHLSREVVKKIYSGDEKEITARIRRIFDFSDSIQLSERRNLDGKDSIFSPLEEEGHFIMFGEKGKGNGTGHDMISFPYSQKQLLKMLVNEDYTEKPTRPKLFSHWIKWTGGQLGTVNKRDFRFFVERSPIFEARAIPLTTLARRCKELADSTERTPSHHEI